MLYSLPPSHFSFYIFYIFSQSLFMRVYSSKMNRVLDKSIMKFFLEMCYIKRMTHYQNSQLDLQRIDCFYIFLRKALLTVLGIVIFVHVYFYILYHYFGQFDLHEKCLNSPTPHAPHGVLLKTDVSFATCSFLVV